MVRSLAKGHNIKTRMYQGWQERTMLFLKKSCTKQVSNLHVRQRLMQSTTLLPFFYVPQMSLIIKMYGCCFNCIHYLGIFFVKNSIQHRINIDLFSVGMRTVTLKLEWCQINWMTFLCTVTTTYTQQLNAYVDQSQSYHQIMRECLELS